MKVDLRPPKAITKADRDYWHKVALSTEPIDRDAAFGTIANIYKHVGLKAPTPYFYDSPMAALEDYPSLLLRDPPGRADKPRHPATDVLAFAFNNGLPDVQGAAELVELTGNAIYGRIIRTLQPMAHPRLMVGGAWSCTRYLIKHDGISRHILTEMAKACSIWFPYNDIVMICDRPKTLKINHNNELHCDDGPAVEWRDGRKLFFWRAMGVPAQYIMCDVTAWTIKHEHNTELRRMLIERVGWDEALKAGIFKEVCSDEYGTLYVDMNAAGGFLSRETYVRVKNSTPEPDGTYKYYMLQVPPTTLTPQEGIASTFGIVPDPARFIDASTFSDRRRRTVRGDHPNTLYKPRIQT